MTGALLNEVYQTEDSCLINYYAVVLCLSDEDHVLCNVLVVVVPCESVVAE